MQIVFAQKPPAFKYTEDMKGTYSNKKKKSLAEPQRKKNPQALRLALVFYNSRVSLSVNLEALSASLKSCKCH